MHSKTRARLLTGVATSALASLIASGTFAAETTIPDFTNAAALGHKVEFASVTNIGSIGAVASGNVGGITVVGTQAGTSNSVTANTVEAAATANAFTNTIDLALIAAAPVDGVAALGLAQNTGVVSSTAADNALRVDLTGFESGTAVNDGNTIRATSNVNTGSTTISGALPNGYASATPGSSASNTDTTSADDLVAAEGSVVATSVQLNAAAGNSASANGNAITLELSSDTSNTVDSSPSVRNNAIASAMTVNSATTAIGLGSTDAPAFTGSAVASNLQSNTGSASAITVGSEISAGITGSNPAIAVNTLDGGLAVAGNTISSSATGNRALGTTGKSGIALTIGDQLSVNGPLASPVAGAAFAYDAGDLAGSATADLVVLNNQGNVGGPIQAITSGAGIGANVQSIDAGTVSVASNTISAQGTGNIASAALTSGKDAAAFAASVAMASQQTNTGSDIRVEATGTQIAAVTGGTGSGGMTSDSTVAATGNTVSATAYGNSASQSVALEANTLNAAGGLTSLTGGTAGATTDGNVSSTGLVTVSNLQSNYSSDVTAITVGSEIGIDADTRIAAPGDVVSGSTLSATGNRQEAVALGSSAGNALSLTGNSVGSGAGVANVQIGGAGADVAAALASARTGVVVGTHVADSSIAVSGTIQRAIGYGASVTNSLAADANTVTAAAGGSGSALLIDPVGVPFHGASQPTVSSAFGLLNDQSILGSVSGGVMMVEVGVEVEGDLTTSSASNTGNGIVGAAYATDAANTLSIDAGSLTTAAFGSVAQLTSTQAVAGAASRVDATAYARVTTDIEDDVSAATIATSTNQIQALSTGNRVTNAMTVEANALDTAASIPFVNTGPAGMSNNAAFGVTNAQSAAGAFTASLLDDELAPTDSARVLTRLGSDLSTITGSAVATDGNQLSAAVTANSAANSISAEGNRINTSMGVQNYQQSSAVLEASIGLAGLPSDPGGPFTFFITATSDTDFNGADNLLTTGTLSIDAAGLSAHEIAYLVADGWTNAGGSVLQRAAAGWSATPLEYAVLMSAGPGLEGGATVPASNGTPNIGGVSIVADGASVVGSTLSVDDNRVSGSVTGNSASNALSINAGAIEGSGAVAGSAQALSVTSDSANAQVIADYALSNVQAVTAPGSLDSAVFGTFSVETAEDAAISDTAISVSGNTQRSVAVANTAANALSNAVALSANSVSAGSALASSQTSEAGVTARSAVDIIAPVAVTGSTVDMSDNANTALAVMNDVANSSTVSATTITHTGGGLPGTVDAAGLVAMPGSVAANGNHVVQNIQSAGAVAVSSNASSYIYNLDELAAATDGITASSVSLLNNATYGEASANRATNTLTVDGASVLGSSAGLGNFQSSAAAVTTNAASVVSVSLSGDAAVPAMLNSTAAIDGNSTTALARGNHASNVLNAVAGSSYGTSMAGGRVDLGGAFGVGSAVSDATFAVLNVQANTGAISASSVGTRYEMALNTAASAVPGVSGSSLSVAGNSVGVEAFGNSASNVLRVSALNTGSPTASLGSSQTNTGNISAVASEASIGVTGYGLASSSSLGVSANTVSARAVGNSVTNAISRVTR
ncbi:beta strand repeat-containing protein [Pseudotabrizicola alkalilacus]|uniref:beta strand repeat-containing protein n=1 Tax=Pseudotabrizicola alkalilacus TaxID=2305252 RepID=UPI0011C0E2F2|nr:S-layer family protein [Pseudotabrizicola alkalilacus]